MLKFFKRQRRRIWAAALLVLLIFALRFPYGKLEEAISGALSSRLPLSGRSEDVRLLWLPPGLGAYNHFLQKPRALSHIEIDEIKAYPAFGKILALKPGLKLRLKEGPSSLEALFWIGKRKLQDEKLREIHAQGRIRAFDLSWIRLAGNPTKFLGKGGLAFQAAVSKDDPKGNTGAASLSFAPLQIHNGLIRANLGPLRLPDLKWRKASLKASLKEEGALSIESLKLGAEGDAFVVQLRGHIDLNWRRHLQKISYYDLQARIDVAAGAESSLTSIVDLFLSQTKTLKPGGGALYLARMRGSGGKPPNIEKLSSF